MGREDREDEDKKGKKVREDARMEDGWILSTSDCFSMVTGSIIRTHGRAVYRQQSPITHSGRYQLTRWSANLIRR